MVFTLIHHYMFSKRSGALVKVISWVSLLGICLSVAAMIIVLNVMAGFNKSIHKRLISVEPDFSLDMSKLKISQKDKVLQYLNKNYSENQFYISSKEDLILRTVEGLFSGVIAKGVEKPAFNLMLNRIHNSPNMPDYANKITELNKGEIIIGEDLAHTLMILRGDEVVVVPPEAMLYPVDEVPPYERLIVKDIIRTNVPDYDEKFVFYIKGDALNSLGKTASRTENLEVFLKDMNFLDKYTKDLKKLDVDAFTWKDKNSSYLYALLLERVAMGCFLGMTVVIASMMILMVLTLLITQKRKDIALFMTMGLSPNHTRKLFTKLGSVLGIIGASFGLILGLGISVLIEYTDIVSLPQNIYYDYKIPVEIDYGLNFGIFLVSLLICYIGSILPAKWGSQIKMVNILRSGV